MIERSDKLNNQAIRFASGGEYPEAIACFKRAIVLDKNNYLLWYNLGVTYRDSGDLINARNALKQALEINPENADAIETLATVCLQLKQTDETLHYANYGLKIDDENPRFWNLLGVSFFQFGQYIEASESFEMAVSYNPYYLDALYNLRDTYEELNNKFGVIECDQRIKEINR